MQGPRTRPRKPVRRGEVLFAVGGWCSGDAIASVERYDPQTNEWRMVAPMSKRRCGVGVAVLNDLLYAVGGHDGQSYLNSIERFDPQTNQWSCDVAPTSSCRTSVGVAVLDGYVMAVLNRNTAQRSKRSSDSRFIILCSVCVCDTKHISRLNYLLFRLSSPKLSCHYYIIV